MLWCSARSTPSTFLASGGCASSTTCGANSPAQETGSKNDAYRWAIRECLARGRCSSRLLCLFEDAFATRRGEIGYVITRDWAVKNRAFVFDLSPSGDEPPGDDPAKRLGLDLETYKLVLAETLRQSAGNHMTEMTGFFVFSKYSDQPATGSADQEVPTEWESVWLISPYNCYQNTISSDCFNQSLHSQAPRQPLKQRRGTHAVGRRQPVALQNKTYLCFLMADYDSAMPLYEFLPRYWHDAQRGRIPLAWGINPNLVETFPDLFAYFYGTATADDTFTADASAAGYMNPNRVRKEYLPLFVRHNRQFFRDADMTIAPMVLDWDQPSPEVKDAFRQFAARRLCDHRAGHARRRRETPRPADLERNAGYRVAQRHVQLQRPGQLASIIANAVNGRGKVLPGFYFFRTVWVGPTTIANAVRALRREHADMDFEVVGPQAFFALFKESQERQVRAPRR